MIGFFSRLLWLIDAHYSKTGVEARQPAMPLEKITLSFRYLLERHGLMEATSINALSSIKKKTDARNPAMLIWSDEDYVSTEWEATYTRRVKVCGVTRKVSRSGKLHPAVEGIHRITAKFRAPVEPPWRVLTRLFGYMTARYSALVKNWTWRLIMLPKSAQSAPCVRKADGMNQIFPKTRRTSEMMP